MTDISILTALLPGYPHPAALSPFIDFGLFGGTCAGGSNIFTKGIRILADNFQTNNLNSPFGAEGVFLPATSGFSAAQGSSKACIKKAFFFDNAVDSLAEIAGGISDTAFQCCSTDQYGGSFFTVKGDFGLDTRLVIRQSGEDCG
ncbi:hypothetical protein MMC22_009244 [Lobaria immixta]|nr:hypothetical protein [Lobaria immixta]